MFRSAVIIFLAAFLCGASAAELDAGPRSRADEPVTLTSAEQVHRLTRQEAQRRHQAVIRGVVTCTLPQYQAVVIQDGTRGVYVSQVTPALGEVPRVGELLEIEGVTDPGEFAPNVLARRMTRLGVGTLPQPVRPTWDQLINGSLDTQYIELPGIVTAVHSNGVTLLAHGGELRTTLPGMEEATLKRYQDSLVRIRGCLFASWNPDTHQVRVGEIRVFSPAITVEEAPPEDAFAIARKRAGELLLFDSQASALRRVKVAGQIIHAREGEYCMMDGDHGLRFIPKGTTQLRVGDVVEVVGFPVLTGPSPVLREAVVRKTGQAALAPPRKLLPMDLFLAEHDSTFVQVEASLLSLSRSQSGQTLELQSGVRRFIARLDARHGTMKSAPSGSRLALTGVYAGRGGSPTMGREISSFELLLNSPADVVVLSRPPWWTIRRVLWALATVTTVLLAAMVWAVTLNRRVRIQTGIIRRQVQREAVLEERTRIARELHDTLEQALAGIGMQLEAATRILSVSDAENTTLPILNMAQSMVRHSQDEARRSVWNLRADALEKGDLPGALSQMRLQARNGSPVDIELAVAGTPRPLPGRVEGHLLRIGQEATTNALKHSRCKTVRLELRYEFHSVQLAVADDGCGFDAQNATSSEAGHFGLLGMRERAEKVGGRLTISSRPRAGTTVTVNVPLEQVDRTD